MLSATVETFSRVLRVNALCGYFFLSWCLQHKNKMRESVLILLNHVFILCSNRTKGKCHAVLYPVNILRYLSNWSTRYDISIAFKLWKTSLLVLHIWYPPLHHLFRSYGVSYVFTLCISSPLPLRSSSYKKKQ